MTNERREKERGEEAGQDLCPRWGAEGEERLLHLGKAPHQRGDQLGQKGSLGGSEESPATSLWLSGQRETYTDGPCHSPACPSLRRVSTGAHGGWGLERGVWRADLGRGLLLAVRRQPEGIGLRSSCPGWPALPERCLSSFLPDGLVCSGTVWSRLWLGGHTQRWG